jgi:cob(I)alamin adenosyltransferase
MSIATRTGDDGTTGLMYNRRVAKSHPRVEAYGTVDELNAALGVARAAADLDFVRETLLPVQNDLITLMGELATRVEDLERYQRDGFRLLGPDLTSRLDRVVAEIESRNLQLGGWATPGGNPCSAALDLARTVCRRAERRVCALQETGGLPNREIIVYLNRLADALWLLARWVDGQSDASGR